MSQPKRGAWRVTNHGKPSPYGVQWREHVWNHLHNREEEKTRTEFFAEEKDRETRLESILAAKAKGEPSLSREELREWRAFSLARGPLSWQTIFANHLAWTHQSSGKACTVSVAEGVKTYLAKCERMTKASPPQMARDNYRHKKRVLDEFAASFGAQLLDQVAGREVEKWIDAFDFPSAATFNNWLKHIKAFFNDAVPDTIAKSPLEGCEKRRHAVDNRNKILTPQECAKLFDFAANHPHFKQVLALAALEAFAGVRTSSAERLAREEVHFAERAFILPAAKLKTGLHGGGSHYVDTTKLPGLEGLWEWIKLAPESAWTLTPRQYLKLKSDWFTAAGVRHPQNTLRKSFATYDLAAHQNPGRTAYVLGHRDQEKLWNDYKGNATTADGVLYQSITPRTACEIAEGGRPRGRDRRRKT